MSHARREMGRAVEVYTRMKNSVFIIESLYASDERLKRFEGDILKRTLALCGKRAKYKYVRSRKQLRAALGRFKASRMRYLHISCHGDKTSIATTHGSLSFDEFASLIRPYLRGRRLFLSACLATNETLAAKVFPDSGCRSLAGPKGKPPFRDSVVMWALFYNLMFRQKLKDPLKNPHGMSREHIELSLSIVSMELTRFRGHCRSHESAVGVVHGQAQTAGVHGGVQG